MDRGSVKAAVVAVLAVLVQRLRLTMQVAPVGPVLLTQSAQALLRHTQVEAVAVQLSLMVCRQVAQVSEDRVLAVTQPLHQQVLRTQAQVEVVVHPTAHSLVQTVVQVS
jgi:hypothetical protein